MSDSFTAPTPHVEFSVPHGWKTEPFVVELSCPDDPGAEIHYTTDGTSPGLDSPLYAGPITVSSTTVLRAGVPDAGAVLQQDSSATVQDIDDSIGEMVEYLKKKGVYENTLVIYTSDQGFFLGDHGMWGKRYMFEQTMKMPFVASWPKGIKPGVVSNSLCVNEDFAP